MGKRRESDSVRAFHSPRSFSCTVAPSSPTNGSPPQFFFRLSSDPKEERGSFPPIPEKPRVYPRRRCHCSPREMCSFLATFFKRRLACYLESRSRPGSHLFSHLGNYPRCLSLRKTEDFNPLVEWDCNARFDAQVSDIRPFFSKKKD